MRRALACCSLLLAAAIMTPSAAHGHPVLVRSTPELGSSVTAPAQLVLVFNGRVEAGLSSVMLAGEPRNTRVALARAAVSGHDEELAFRLPVLDPGLYRAEWKVMSADGHISDGVIQFTVVSGTR